MLRATVVFAWYWNFTVAAGFQGTDATCLNLRAEVYAGTVHEGLPLVVRVTLANICESPVETWYYADSAGLMERWAVIVAEDVEGDVFRLDYVGGVGARVSVPVPMPLVNGAPLVKDFVRSLICREKPPRQWAGKSRDLLRFLPPGSYVAHLEVPHMGGTTLISNDFRFEVVRAQGADAGAKDDLRIAHADFFEGRDRPADEGMYDGRRWYKTVDVSRFGEIQKLLEDYPDSVYAEWIRFWKVYHHGSPEEVLGYARAHRDFPLGDDLMLRVIVQLSNDDEQAQRALELLDELSELFPEGDTRAAALRLKEKLSKKP